MSSERDLVELYALEERRIAAGASGDIAALTEIFGEDHIHVHGNGRAEDRAGLMRTAAALLRRTEPRRPDIRVYGDFAILTGPLTLSFDRGQGEETAHMYATQVARRIEGEWRFISMQVTRTAG